MGLQELPLEAISKLWGVRVHPGDIVLTGGNNSPLSKAIRWGQSLFTGKPSRWRHAMRAAEEPGMVYSQEQTYRLRSLAQDTGSLVRVWRNVLYTHEQRELLLEEAAMNLGRLYDAAGLVGQGFRWIPLIGDWLASKVDAPMLTFCSEAVIYEERTVDKDYFNGGHTAQKSPQEINDYNAGQAEWHPFTFKLVGGDS